MRLFLQLKWHGLQMRRTSTFTTAKLPGPKSCECDNCWQNLVALKQVACELPGSALSRFADLCGPLLGAAMDAVLPPH
jgi:predicted amidophosphoribosyltransferase